MITETYINSLSKRVHKANVKVGWWDDPNPCIYGKLQLASTEVAEATEGLRKGLMDDKLPHRVMEEVELADTFIRAVDLGAKYGLRYSLRPARSSDPWNIYLLSDHGKHLYINRCIIALADSFYFERTADFKNEYYSDMLNAIIDICAYHDYDLAMAIEEKILFNANRKDHKRENRAKERGKKF